MDYKQWDTERIICYLKKYPEGLGVEDIIAHSGAEKLRVYPALFELEQSGCVRVLERGLLGAPERVLWLK